MYLNVNFTATNIMAMQNMWICFGCCFVWFTLHKYIQIALSFDTILFYRPSFATFLHAMIQI